MSDTVIRVENLGKKYIIGHQQEGQARYKSLRDVIANGAKSVGKFNPFSSKGGLSKSSGQEEFWALKDVSFEIKRGDRVGIIGRNGAGKSTLLKILSRITEPTEGEIKIRGRVASLLEVGTGFHPELTGRENIYLNGAILGMSREEIKRKFDEIVAFAEVERFLDTPVKRYSSGMYVRLAFAVAAHLEPEILIVDEVLAVGDAQFQKKCLGKMEDVSREGRTILFVSHSMSTVTSLCSRAIWLMSGQVHKVGDAEEITSQYLLYGSETFGDVYISERNQKSYFKFNRVTLLNQQDEITSSFDLRKSFKIRIAYQIDKKINDVEIAFRVYSSTGVPIFTLNRSSYLKKNLEAGKYISEIEIPARFLSPCTYSITIAAHIPMVEILALHEDLISFEINETGSNMAVYKGNDYGYILVDFPWKESFVL